MIFQPTKFGKSIISSSRRPAWLRLLLRGTGSVGIDVRSCYEHWENLGYLEYLPQLSTYSIGFGLDLQSLSGLASQIHLKSLSLGFKSKCKVDWENFQDLEKVYCQGCFVDESIWFLQHLEDLAISNCSEKDWSNVSRMIKLATIELIGEGCTDFKGLNSHRLRSISIHHNCRLSSLESDSDLSQVEDLCITACRNLGSISGVQKFTGLKNIFIDDCGVLESLKPLLALENLVEISFLGTIIADGIVREIAAIKTLKRINFNDNFKYDSQLLECLVALGIPKPEWPLMFREPKKWAKITRN